ncbi:MAG: dipeptidase [Hyphomicrobiaceae bacterium]|nr:dipeptidase [Hyphomicrobiaceae bacterium]
MSLAAVLARLDANADSAVERLFELLRIPSISTDPAYKDDVARAADWCARQLAEVGFDAAVRPTTGHPMVVAHWRGKVANPGAASVLFYGHYDVQPVDPLSLWETDPFDPRLVSRDDGSKIIVARGAADDKGQLLTFIEAARAYVAETGGMPCPVTVFLEGEEESGSPSLKPFLTANRAELAKDVALVCDTNMLDRTTPAITATLRGMVKEEMTLTAASRDLHSGMYGGPAQNPIRALAKVLAKLHDDQGRVTVPGFYDGVPELPAEVKAQWENLGLTPESFLGAVGLSISTGEEGRSIAELVWARPTCEFNGITGGYTGEGFKTVLPAEASTKISMRLVGDQDPEAISRNFRAFIEANLPADCKVSFAPFHGTPALRLAFDSPWLDKAKAALADEWGVPAVVMGSGGSIPVVGDFKQILGMDSLMVGFGLDDDRIHSPNEKYELSSFLKGARSWARILDRIAG